MRRSRRTTVSSVRIDEKLYQTGELLKARHPHYLSQSRIYAAGLKAIIEEFKEKGEQIPEDVIGALIDLRQSEIDSLEQEKRDLQDLQVQQSTRVSRTLAGNGGAKPGYKMVDGVAVEVDND
jgi:hypothetical protein